jgi:hypothetical protein
LASVIGHADRNGPLRGYGTGRLLPAERKSVEPMAAMTALARPWSQHQSMLDFVGKAPWSEERLLAKVRDLVLPTIEAHGPIHVWIVDDTAFPKRGKHSLRVTRQDCRQLGKQDNGQVAATLFIANDWPSPRRPSCGHSEEGRTRPQFLIRPRDGSRPFRSCRFPRAKSADCRHLHSSMTYLRETCLKGPNARRRAT